MQKRLIPTLILIFFTISLNAQNLVVSEIKQVTSLEKGVFHFPKLFPGGTKILMSTENYNGLYYYDLEMNSMATVTAASGAGYEPVISGDGSAIIYRVSEYKNRRRYSSIIKQDLISGTSRIMITDRRSLSTPRLGSANEIILLDNTDLQRLTLSEQAKTANQAAQISHKPVAFIENTAIILISAGEKKMIQPMGEGHYIWPSVSPDGQRLLFTKMGEATYITDLDGSNPVSLGRANAPGWSPDGNWVVFMDDKDDGYVVLESDIFAVSADGQQKIRLTDTSDRIEMDPEWGYEMDKLVFASDRGEIFLMTIEIQ